MRPFAVFDIDGTVIRWQLYHALADELVRQGRISAEDFQRVREARMTWKRRAGENSFLSYEEALISLVNEAQVGLPVKDFEAACRSVINEYRDQVYTYTRNLIKELKANGYLLFAVSASHAQIVGMFAEYYGFDDYGGSEYEVIKDRLTGRLTLLMKSERKPEFLKQLAARYHADWKGSIAVGDSESDIPMLEIVDCPIAFNPTKALFKHAKQKNWKVVIERKNMVYQLEVVNGSYILAPTDG